MHIQSMFLLPMDQSYNCKEMPMTKNNSGTCQRAFLSIMYRFRRLPNVPHKGPPTFIAQLGQVAFPIIVADQSP